MPWRTLPAMKRLHTVEARSGIVHGEQSPMRLAVMQLEQPLGRRRAVSCFDDGLEGASSRSRKPRCAAICSVRVVMSAGSAKGLCRGHESW